MVLLFDEMFGDDPAGRRRLEAFLGVRFAEGPPPRMNVGGKVRSPVMAALLDNDAAARRAEAAAAARRPHPDRPAGAGLGRHRAARARAR